MNLQKNDKDADFEPKSLEEQQKKKKLLLKRKKRQRAGVKRV